MLDKDQPAPQERFKSGLTEISGDPFIQKAFEIVSSQVSALQELALKVADHQRALDQKCLNVKLELEEVQFKLRQLAGENKSAPSFKAKEKLASGPQKLLQHQNKLEEQVSRLSRDLEDLAQTFGRLQLLIRQSEIAGSRLMVYSSPVQPAENAWEVTLQAGITEAEEAERVRLARKIHDGLAQVLANAAMQIDFVNQLVRKDRPRANDRLANLGEVLADSLAEVRGFIFELQPKMLKESGLGAIREASSRSFPEDIIWR